MVPPKPENQHQNQHRHRKHHHDLHARQNRHGHHLQSLHQHRHKSQATHQQPHQQLRQQPVQNNPSQIQHSRRQNSGTKHHRPHRHRFRNNDETHVALSSDERPAPIIPHVKKKQKPRSESLPPSSRTLHDRLKRRSSVLNATGALLHVYSESAIRRRDTVLYAGYGVYAPLYGIRIAEPLSGLTQTLQRAELASFHSALELIHGLRARAAIVHIRAPLLVRDFRQACAETTISPESNRRLWNAIRTLTEVLTDRGVRLYVRNASRHSTSYLRLAHNLARHGSKLHVTCPLCLHSHGRQWKSHYCRPVCLRGTCDGRTFPDPHAYWKHVRNVHALTCPIPQCPFFCVESAELAAHCRQAHGTHGPEYHLPGNEYEHAGYSRQVNHLHHFRDGGKDGSSIKRKRVWCTFCGKKFGSRQHLNSHIRHSCTSAPQCYECGRTFLSETGLRTHLARKSWLNAVSRGEVNPTMQPRPWRVPNKYHNSNKGLHRSKPKRDAGHRKPTPKDVLTYNSHQYRGMGYVENGEISDEDDDGHNSSSGEENEEGDEGDDEDEDDENDIDDENVLYENERLRSGKQPMDDSAIRENRLAVNGVNHRHQTPAIRVDSAWTARPSQLGMTLDQAVWTPSNESQASDDDAEVSADDSIDDLYNEEYGDEYADHVESESDEGEFEFEDSENVLDQNARPSFQQTQFHRTPVVRFASRPNMRRVPPSVQPSSFARHRKTSATSSKIINSFVS